MSGPIMVCVVGNKLNLWIMAWGFEVRVSIGSKSDFGRG